MKKIVIVVALIATAAAVTGAVKYKKQIKEFIDKKKAEKSGEDNEGFDNPE
jgi:hypothetical protein